MANEMLKSGKQVESSSLSHITATDIVSFNRVLAKGGFITTEVIERENPDILRPYKEIPSLTPKGEKLQKEQESGAVNSFLTVVEQSLDKPLSITNDGNNIQKVTKWLVENHTDDILKCSEDFINSSGAHLTDYEKFLKERIEKIKKRREEKNKTISNETVVFQQPATLP